MSLIEGRAHVGGDGKLHIPLPPTMRGKDVKYTLDVQPSDAPQTNGAPTADADQVVAQARWRAHINRFAGSMPDFPDVERPGPDSYEQRESLD